MFIVEGYVVDITAMKPCLFPKVISLRWQNSIRRHLLHLRLIFESYISQHAVKERGTIALSLVVRFDGKNFDEEHILKTAAGCS